MASTITFDDKESPVVLQGLDPSQPSNIVRTGTINLGTYATNGVALTLTQLELDSLDYMGIDNASGYRFEYLYSTNKVKVYVSNSDSSDSPAREVDNSTNLASVNPHFVLVGKRTYV